MSRGFNARAAICTAQQILDRQGYSSARVVTDHNLYDIVAWQKGQVLLISIQASRHFLKRNYSDRITALSGLLRDRQDPNLAAELWIYSRSKWLQWEIFPGGAIQRRDES